MGWAACWVHRGCVSVVSVRTEPAAALNQPSHRCATRPRSSTQVRPKDGIFHHHSSSRVATATASAAEWQVQALLRRENSRSTKGQGKTDHPTKPQASTCTQQVWRRCACSRLDQHKQDSLKLLRLVSTSNEVNFQRRQVVAAVKMVHNLREWVVVQVTVYRGVNGTLPCNNGVEVVIGVTRWNSSSQSSDQEVASQASNSVCEVQVAAAGPSYKYHPNKVGRASCARRTRHVVPHLCADRVCNMQDSCSSHCCTSTSRSM